jgi:periplasmic divalent cation tolerance protein
MTSKRVMQIQVVHSDRDVLDGIITDLVDQRLIACGQVIGPISSTFFWEGSVQREDEWLALLKTGEGVVADLVARLAELHSYDVPEILVTEVVGGHVPYLDWVVEQTARG